MKSNKIKDLKVVEEVELPEFHYNVRIIASIAEIDVKKFINYFNARKRYEEELDIVDTIARTLERVRSDSSSGVLNLDSLYTVFSDMKQQFGREYKIFNLSAIARSFAYPLLVKLFKGWDPLLNPSHGHKVMTLWKDFYYDDSNHYVQLANEVVFPAIMYGTISWEANEPNSMLRFLALWDDLLPCEKIQTILDNVVTPKLSIAVESWDPQQEGTLIHSWVHPWCQILGWRLETLFPVIRSKLGKLISASNLIDSSISGIISLWKDILGSTSWMQMVTRFIIPKLTVALQEFEVNPTNQKLDNFYSIISWAPLIPMHDMVDLLEDEFFNKWHQALYQRLSFNNPNPCDVLQWYMGWSRLFPHEFIENERIQTLLCIGLKMMEQAANGKDVIMPLARVKKVKPYNAPQFQDEWHKEAVLCFTEIVGEYAKYQGLCFVPKVGKSYHNFQIYAFGNVMVYIDAVKELIYAQEKEGWIPVTLKQLVHMHHCAA